MLGSISCGSGGSDTGPIYVLNMSHFAPTADNAAERVMLNILPGGDYEILHSPKQPKTGVLSQADLAELEAHTTSAATAALVDAAEPSYDRCADHADSYAIDVGDRQGASRSNGIICLVPTRVEGTAKEHLSGLVALFSRLTEDISQ